jgi:pectinesterase
MGKKCLYTILFLVLFAGISYSGDNHFITVAKDGTGDFTTINQALQSLPMFNYERVIIYIKSGIYEEKVRITRDFVTLRGENKLFTIIKYSQLRSDWEARKDSIGPAVINVFADDFIMENLTVKNTQPEVGPHAFTVYGEGTRTIIFNCNVVSCGGDTVSLWNYKNGMYYHSNCVFVGAVDFVCPRGWCYINNSSFHELKKTASIWHAGGYDKNQKLVIKNSSFGGVEGFQLGRHHYDAQFYLINCSFSNHLKDTPVYRVSYNDPLKDRAFNWGPRYYFYNCKKEDGNFAWFSNNLTKSDPSITPDKITSEWTFGGRWNPESEEGPKIINYKLSANSLHLEFNELLTVKGIPRLKSKTGKEFLFAGGNGSAGLVFTFEGLIKKEDLTGLTIINDASIAGTTASLKERSAVLSIKL